MLGVANLAPTASVTLLTSASMNDETLFDRPDAIVPQSFERAPTSSSSTNTPRVLTHDRPLPRPHAKSEHALHGVCICSCMIRKQPKGGP